MTNQLFEPETNNSSVRLASKRKNGWRILACVVIITVLLVIAAAHIHVERLGNFQVTLFRFANMNGLESDRILLKQEIESVYPDERLNVDIDYKGRSLTGKLDYYYILIERGDVLIKCFGTDDMKTSDRPHVLWDTAFEISNYNLYGIR